MGFSLAPTAVAQGYRLEAHETVGSTNALALERAAAGDPGRLWVVSRRQETGRGRRGRVWSTAAGNLAATLLVGDVEKPADAATLGFVAGLALADALEALAPVSRAASGHVANAPSMDHGITLKWPNDVLVGGAKLSGIGLESTMGKGGRLAIAVGIGVNVVEHPADLPYPATSLAGMGWPVDAERLFLALSDAWAEKAGVWNRGAGLGVIRDQWLQRAAGIGKPVSVRIGERSVSGTFETIDEACRLVVRADDGTVSTVTAGDVHFGAAHTAAIS